jgi:hypothetical protein
MCQGAGRKDRFWRGADPARIPASAGERTFTRLRLKAVIDPF